MVVYDLHIVSVTVFPNKADTVLIIDPNAVLAEAIALQRFQPIAGELCQVGKLNRRVDLNQFLFSGIGDPVELSREAPFKDRLCVL